jgi:hypothetical protein
MGGYCCEFRLRWILCESRLRVDIVVNCCKFRLRVDMGGYYSCYEFRLWVHIL